MLILHSLIMLLVSFSNSFFIVWTLMEVMSIVSMLLSMEFINKVGLMIYFFPQSMMSLLLTIMVTNISDSKVLVIMAKLGLFPFFYRVIMVSVKPDLILLIMILSVQKLSVFWMLMLLDFKLYSVLILVLISMSNMFLVLVLYSLNDFWLLMIYTSVVNTGLIILSMDSNYYLIMILLHMVFFIFVFSSSNSNYGDNPLLVIMLLMAIPVFSLISSKMPLFVNFMLIKLILFIMVSEVCLLFYYLSVYFGVFLLVSSEFWVFLTIILMLLVTPTGSNFATTILSH